MPFGTRKPKQVGETELFAYALKSLAARSSSVGEMRTKLMRRALRPTDVDLVIGRLKEAGYLNDARFAESFAGYRLENQRLGRRRVERDLRTRKVAPAVAATAIANAYEGADETVLIREHIAKRLRRTSKVIDGKPLDRKAIASLYRHLVTAGFSASLIFPELRRLNRDEAAAIEEEVDQ